MPTTVFLSWQADTPTKEGRNLVERALERAVARIGQDTTIEEAVRGQIAIDRDTKNVPGSPPIVDTIFKKIDQAAVFIPDLTFVGTRRDGRPTPNPNVLIEYGWALKSLGHGRIVPVMNTAFGEPKVEAMPFDMRHLRNPIQYHCPNDSSEKARKQARDALSQILESAIRGVLSSKDFLQTLPIPPKLSTFPAQEARDGPARFRAKGDPIGVSDSSYSGKQITLSDGPSFWLRLMPNSDPGRTWQVSELCKLATSNPTLLPLNRRFNNYDWVRGYDGFGVCPAWGSNDPTPGLVYVFKTGEIWSIDAYAITQAVNNNCPEGFALIEEFFTQALDQYSDFLVKLGCLPPFHWIAGVSGVKGVGLWVPVQPGYVPLQSRPRGACMLDVVLKEGSHTPETQAIVSLRPFFLSVYESCGLERPSWLDTAKN